MKDTKSKIEIRSARIERFQFYLAKPSGIIPSIEVSTAKQKECAFSVHACETGSISDIMEIFDVSCISDLVGKAARIVLKDDETVGIGSISTDEYVICQKNGQYQYLKGDKEKLELYLS